MSNATLKQYLNVKVTDKCNICEQPVAKSCCAENRRLREIENVSYAEWLPNVRILNPEVPDNVLLDFIRRACIEFCKKSSILRRKITIVGQDCVSDYYPCLGGEERIQKVMKVACGCQTFAPTFDHACPENGTFWFAPPSTMEISPPPKDGQEITVWAVAAPSETSVSVDRIVYDRFFEAIENYSAAKASSVPTDTSSLKTLGGSKELYASRMATFKNAIGEAKLEIVTKYSGPTWD